MTLCGKYQLHMSKLTEQCGSAQTSVELSQVYCLITLKRRDKTRSELRSHCSLYSVVLTVPDKVPFSTGTDTAHPPHRSVVYLHVPQNTAVIIEEMDVCWTDVSLLVTLAPKIRGCGVHVHVARDFL